VSAGLALVYELVRLHGGTVEVTSQLGFGTASLLLLQLLLLLLSSTL
jgi:signal transduction histidine kinase